MYRAMNPRHYAACARSPPELGAEGGLPILIFEIEGNLRLHWSQSLSPLLAERTEGR